MVLQMAERMTCRQCGYDMTGLGKRACPECGQEAPLDATSAKPSIPFAAVRVIRTLVAAHLVICLAALLEFAVLAAVVWGSPSFPWHRTVPLWANSLDALSLVALILVIPTIVCALCLVAWGRIVWSMACFAVAALGVGTNFATM